MRASGGFSAPDAHSVEAAWFVGIALSRVCGKRPAKGTWTRNFRKQLPMFEDEDQKDLIETQRLAMARAFLTAVVTGIRAEREMAHENIRDTGQPVRTDLRPE